MIHSNQLNLMNPAIEYIFGEKREFFNGIIQGLNENNVDYLNPLNSYPILSTKKKLVYINLPFNDVIVDKENLVSYHEDKMKKSDTQSNFESNEIVPNDVIRDGFNCLYQNWETPIGIDQVQVINTTESYPNIKSGKFRTNFYTHKLQNPTVENIIKAVAYTKDAKTDWWYEGCPISTAKVVNNTTHLFIEWDHTS